MSQPIDTAYVEVKPDLDRFGATLAAKLSAALKRAQTNVDRSMRETSDRVGAEGERAGQQFGDGFTRDANGRLHDARGRFVAEGRSAGDAFGRGFNANAKKAIDRLKTSITHAVSGLSSLTRSTVGVTALAGKVGIAATAIAGLASAAAGAIPILAGLTAALATASGSLLAIPGAVAAGIAAFGTLKVGLIGVDAAMKAVAKGDASKLNEALKDLAPNAQAFVRQINALKPAFDKLRLAVQNALFANTASTLNTLATALLPAVRAGMVGVATVLNQQVVSALRGLNTEANRTNLAGIFAAARDAIGQIGPALQPALQALLDVGAVMSGVVADLTEGLGRNIGVFAERISELARSGALAQIFRDGLDVAGQLFSALRDIGGVVSGIFKAAGTAGGGGLLAFLDRLNETVNSLAGQQALQNLFGELARVGEALQPVLLAVAEGLGPVARGIADIAVAFGPVLTGLAGQLGPALASLAPAVIALAPAVTALGGALQPLADIIANLVTGAAPGITRFVEGLAAGLEALAPAAAPVGQALGNLLTALAPLLPLIGAQLANVLTIAAGALSTISVELGPLIGLIADMGAEFARTLLPVLVELGRVGIPIAAAVGQVLVEAFQPLAPVLLDLARTIATQLLAYLPQIQSTMAQLLPVVAQVAGALGQALLVALQEIAPVLPQLVQAGLQLVLAFTQLVVALAPLLPDLTQLITLVTQLLVNPAGLKILIVILQLTTGQLQLMAAVIGGVSSAFAAVSGAVGRFAGAVRDGIGKAVAVAKELPGKVKDAVGNLGQLLYETGKDVVRGLWNGISSLGSWLASKVSDFIDKHVPAPIRQALGVGSPSKVAADIGRWVPAGLAVGILANKKPVADAASQLAAAAVPNLSAADASIAAMRQITSTTGPFTAATTPPAATAQPAGAVPVVNVYIGDELLETRAYRVATRVVAANNTAQARAVTYQPRTV